MKKLVIILVPSLLLVCGDAFCAPDGFNSVRCGADVPAALRGRSLPGGTVVKIQDRHKDLKLEDLGADELDNGGSLISWRICGDEFMMIVDRHSLIRDVLKIPPHSKSAPESAGPCKLNGADLPGVVVAILDRKEGGPAGDHPATIAWKVDEKKGQFIPLPTAELLCSGVGIFTVDGGT